MKPYAYQCKDYSLLTPIFKKVLVTPLLPLIPRAVPANIITIISNVLFYLALYLSFQPGGLWYPVRLAVPLLLLLYLIGDHLDGAQAKRTGTGSALGEFCDHYLDAFNNGILWIIVFHIFAIDHPAIVVWVVTTSYWAHVAVFYEQFKTGWLIFEKVGSLEGVALAIVLIAGSFFDPVRNFLCTTVYYHITIIEYCLIAVGFGAVYTFVKTVRRTPHVRYSLLVYVAGSVITGYFGNALFSGWQLVALLTLYSSLYLGKVMRGHLTDGVERSPGLFAPVFVLFVALTGFYEAYAFYVLFWYLIVSVLWLAVVVFRSLGQYWVWKNPVKK